MKGVSGWCGVTGQSVERSLLEVSRKGLLTSAISQPGQADTSKLYINSTEVERANGSIAGIQGQYHWRDPQFEKIRKAEGESSALLKAYEKYKKLTPTQIVGRFSLAHIDTNTNSVFLATDRMGVEPVNYYVDKNALIFSSSLDFISCFSNVSELSQQSIFHYFFFHQIPSPRTIYNDHQRLMPGNYLYFHDGQVEEKRYWSPEFTNEKDTSYRFEELKEEFDKTLRLSVNNLLSEGKNGAFLSGGTDSSTVTGILTGELKESISTYSIGFDAQGYDEMHYAKVTAKHFSSKHHEYYVTPEDIVNAVPDVARIYSEPFGNSSAVPTYYCAKMAQADGIDRLFAGDGGDELFAGNERYSKQVIFSYFDQLPEFARKSLLPTLIESGAYPGKIFPFNKIKSYIQQAGCPMPDRLLTYNLAVRLGLDKMFTEEFRVSFNDKTPYEEYANTYNSVNAGTMLNKMLGLDFKFTLTDNDLPKVTKMCELAGVDVAFPLLSDELLDFSFKMPIKLKLKGTELRYFFKEALKDFLPQEVLAKQKHGFGLPFGVWAVNDPKLKALIYDNLTTLKKRNIIQPDFIDKLLSEHLPAYPHYYGEMVWLLLMFESWYVAHVSQS